MYLPNLELHEASSLGEACEMMVRYGPDARLLAGGTDLLVDLKTGRVQCNHLISISGISALRGVSAEETGMRIGALTTITELSRSSFVRDRYPAILDATRDMAATQIRNLATVGGNIASAVPCADLPPILMVLGATVSLWSTNGERTLPLESFYLGPRETVRRPDETLTFVHVPEPVAGFGAAYSRLALREGNAIAVASVAAALTLEDNDTIADARLALGAVAPLPKLVESAGRLLRGKRADDHAFEAAGKAAMDEAEPISDIRGSAEYRRKMIGVLTRRALCTARDRAREAGP